MHKPAKYALLGLFAILATATSSCEKQNPKTDVLAALSEQNAHDKLVINMANDPLVKRYLLAEMRFPAEYNAWFNSLTVAEQAAHTKAELEAERNNLILPFASHSEAQIEAIFKQETALFEQVKLSYPEFAALELEQQNEVLERIAPE
jgi:hypothetical protein